MKQIVQDVRSGETTVKEIPYPLASPGRVLIAEVASAISAATERYVVDIARKSLLGKAREKAGRCQTRPSAELGSNYQSVSL
jgi:hypothetical protein